MSIALFYENPRPIEAARDAGLKVREIRDLGFARQINSIPINLSEFAAAARSYPIGFVGDDAFPSAIVGLGKTNLFLDEAGRWKPGAYVPAFVRRYPFMFGDTDTRNEFKLCIDDTDRAVSADEGRPLFENGEPTALTKQAMEFCRTFHVEGQTTNRFVRAVRDADLLVARQAETRLASGEAPFVLSGFKSVDPAKLQKLTGRVLAQWNERNWLAPLFVHLQSMTNWNDLMRLMEPAE
jgi:hypothetical protein